MLLIQHTHAEGTLVQGTSRGDGAGAILRSVHGHFRWSRTVDAWILLHSRDRPAKTDLIEQARKALQAAGFEVEVSIDDSTRRDVTEVELDRANRAQARAERHQGLAARAAERSTKRAATNQEIRKAIPLGQPLNNAPFVKRLHKSDEIVRRDIDKQQHHQDRAESARMTQQHRENPNVTTRRIERLKAERRRLERNRGHYPSRRYTALHAGLTGQIDYWTSYLAELRNSDSWRPWEPRHFRKGDMVACRGQWSTVLRVNPKSLTVDVWFSGNKMSWTERLPYDKVTGRERDGQALAAPPDDEALPVSQQPSRSVETFSEHENRWTQGESSASGRSSRGLDPL